MSVFATLEDGSQVEIVFDENWALLFISSCCEAGISFVDQLGQPVKLGDLEWGYQAYSNAFGMRLVSNVKRDFYATTEDTDSFRKVIDSTVGDIGKSIVDVVKQVAIQKAEQRLRKFNLTGGVRDTIRDAIDGALASFLTLYDESDGVMGLMDLYHVIFATIG